MRRTCIQLAAAWLVLVAMSSPASASVLRWRAPRTCPDEQAARALAVRLGVPMEVGDSDDFSIDIEALPGGGFGASIGVRGAGVRRVEGDECLRVAEAAVLVIAIAHDPMAVAERLAWEDGASMSERLEAPPRTRVGAYAGLDLGADFLALPRATAGGGLALGLVLPRAVRVELAGYSFLPRSTTKGPTGGTSGEIGLFSGVFRSCVEFSLGAIRGGPCLAAELGVMTGRGRGLEQGRSVKGIWSAGWVGLGLGPRETGRFVPGLRVELGTPFECPTFEVEGFGTVFRPSRWLVRAMASLQVALF